MALSTYPGTVRVINLERWNSFPDEVKQIISDAVAYEQSTILVENLKAVANFITTGQAEHGMQIHDASALNAVVRAYQEEVKAGLADEPVAEGVTGGDFLAEYEEYMDKWRQHFEELGLPSGDPSHTVATEIAALAAEADETWGAPIREAFLELTAGLYD